MKQLYIIRHAKTEDIIFQDMTDYERKLLPKGQVDAQLVADRLVKNNIIPDIILSSSAVRTTQTTQIIRDSMNLSHVPVHFYKELYLCDWTVIEDMVKNFIPVQANVAFIVAHNFGVTDYVNHKIDQFRIDNMPTACVVGLSLPFANWIENDATLKGKYLYMDYPKKSLT